MSTFNVTIKRIRAIEPHPNADALEFAVIDGYRSIVKKGEFKEGALIAYIPEGALIPAWLLKKQRLWREDKSIGALSGKEGNRVKAIRLRGELSQGLCVSTAPAPTGAAHAIQLEDTVTPDGTVLEVWQAVTEGQDVATLLGITKYEPPIPVSMAGEVFNAGQELTLGFDVENWKAYPEVLQEGEPVVFTEKLHGTCTVLAILPYANAHPEAFGERKNILLFSKGLGSKGLVFKNNEKNRANLYVRSTRSLVSRIDDLQREDAAGPSTPLFILGETYGPGVQDLAYGDKVAFRAFAAVNGYRGEQRFWDWSCIESELKPRFEVETVPVLYRGPYSEAAMREHTDGKTSMGVDHIREGIVIVPQVERRDPLLGRVCLKSVSADYLTRKNATEFS